MGGMALLLILIGWLLGDPDDFRLKDEDGYLKWRGEMEENGRR